MSSSASRPTAASPVGRSRAVSLYAPETALDVESMIVHALALELICLLIRWTDSRHRRVVRCIHGHSFAKCAIEMALWDILGKHAGTATLSTPRREGARSGAADHRAPRPASPTSSGSRQKRLSDGVSPHSRSRSDSVSIGMRQWWPLPVLARARTLPSGSMQKSTTMSKKGSPWRGGSKTHGVELTASRFRPARLGRHGLSCAARSAPTCWPTRAFSIHTMC